MGKNSKATTAIRDKAIRSILQTAQAPNPGIPVPGAGFSDTSLSTAGRSIGKEFKAYGDDNSMGGSAGRTEADYQAQREGEREDMRQFGDDDEHRGLMGASLMGSRKYTKREVKKGYRKI